MRKIFFLASVVLMTSLAAFSQKIDYQVYALKFASGAHPTPISAMALNGPDKDSVNLVFMVWLIKGSDGKNILVDAGFLKDVEEAKGFDISNYVRPDSVLLRMNLRKEDITDIILSHPHWDHLDGIDLFPNAHVWIQKEDYNYFIETAWQKGGNSGGFNKRDVRKLMDIKSANRLTLVDGDNKEIIPGIKVFTGSKHTFNSQYVLVETGADKIILASDNIWIYYNLEHLRPAPLYGTFDTAAYVRSMQRMKTQVSDSKYIIPGHDAKMFSIFPTVKEGVIRIK